MRVCLHSSRCLGTHVLVYRQREREGEGEGEEREREREREREFCDSFLYSISLLLLSGSHPYVLNSVL